MVYNKFENTRKRTGTLCSPWNHNPEAPPYDGYFAGLWSDHLLNKSRSHVPYSLGFGACSIWTQNQNTVSSFRCHPQSRLIPALILQLQCPKCRKPLGPLAELLVILLRAERGSVFAPSRRKACKRWKTGPPAGWLFAPSRPTPKATESWRQGEAGKGYVGTWRNVLSACRHGEPAQPWVGTDTAKGCKKQRHQKKKWSSSSFYFQVEFAKIKALRQLSPFRAVYVCMCDSMLPLLVIRHIEVCILPAVVGEAELGVYTRRGKEYRRTGAVKK